MTEHKLGPWQTPDPTHQQLPPGSWAPPPHALPPAGHHGYGGWGAVPQQRAMPVGAIVVLSTVGALVTVFVLAVFGTALHSIVRDETVHRATSVTAPSTVPGMLPVADGWSDAQLAVMGDAIPSCVCTLDDRVSGAFGNPYGDRRLFVVAGRLTYAAGAREQTRVERDFWDATRAQGAMVGEPVQHHPGPLGGVFSCAQVTIDNAYGYECVAVDAGAMVVVVELATEGPPPAPAHARDVRQLVEKRS